MARSLTTPATTEKNKANGAQPIYILQIDWGGGTGTKYYAGEALSSPVTAEGRVMDWGSVQISAEPGRTGGHGQVQITLADPDLVLRGLIETKPGPQNKKCYIHLYFGGTTWSMDRITIFGGIIDTPCEWDDKTAQWKLSLKGLEALYNKQIGRYIDRDAFPDVICDECEGEIVPIVYGNPVRRVPACIIDRPGQSALYSRIDPFSASFTIQDVASDARFTTSGTRTLIIGYPGNYETFTGTWDGVVNNQFNISTRDSVIASGSVASLYGSGGRSYVMIPIADVPNYQMSRGGYPISFQISGTWYTTLVTQWDISGSNIIVCDVGQLGVVGGTTYKLWRFPGQLPIWPVGTPVYEVATWTWVTNWLPSKSIDLIECKTKIQLPGGNTVDAFLQLNSSYYSVSLDDKTWNTALGRGGTDPGLTTITMSQPPIAAGAHDPRIYVTLKGITNDNTATGTVLSDPADIIKNLLGNSFIGAIPSGEIDSTSFSAAATAITQTFQLAITKPVKLIDLCGELAYQAGAVLFWDGGQARIKKLADTLSSGDSVYTFTESNYARQTLRLRETSLKDVPTQVTGKFRTSLAAPESKLVRRCDEAVTSFGWRDDNLDMWAHQDPVNVAAIIEFWLKFKLQQNQVIQLDTFLNGVHLQPGDTVTLNIAHAGTTVLSSVLGRVKTIRHQLGSANRQQMDRITIEFDVKLYSFTVSAVTPTTRNCNPTTGIPDLNVGPGAGIGSGSRWVTLLNGRGQVSWPSYRPEVLGGTGGSGSGSGGGTGSGSGSGGLTYPALGTHGTGSWTGGSSKTVTIYTGTAGSETATGLTVSAYLPTGLTIAANGKVIVQQVYGGTVYAYPHTC